MGYKHCTVCQHTATMPYWGTDTDDSLLQHTRYRVSQATKNCIRNTDNMQLCLTGYLESATSAGCKAMPASGSTCGLAMLLSLLWNVAVFQSLTQLALEEATDLIGSAAASVSGSKDVMPAALPPAMATTGCWNSDSCALRVKISCSRSCRRVQSISRTASTTASTPLTRLLSCMLCVCHFCWK